MTESTYEANGGVAVLTLSNPPGNLFTLEVGEDIRSGVERAREEGARAMVIQADGAVFSGGADVSLFKDRSLEEARDLMPGSGRRPSPRGRPGRTRRPRSSLVTPSPTGLGQPTAISVRSLRRSLSATTCPPPSTTC